MPFFFPIIVLAGSALVGGFGVKKGVDGVSAMRRAKRIGEDAEARHGAHKQRFRRASDKTVDKMKELAAQRLRVNETTVSRMIEFLELLEQTGKKRQLDSLARVGISAEQVQKFVSQYVELGGTFRGAVTAGAAGAGAGAATTGLVTSFATAGTGAAISGLSGAALESAVLAWLGGGSLAAGGGGMALGTAVLGGVMAAPALLVGGFVLASQGEKAITKATEYEAEVSRACAQITTMIDVLERAQTRTRELSDVLREVDSRASHAVARLWAISSIFSGGNEHHVKAFQTAMLLTKAASALLTIKVLDAKGALTDESQQAIGATQRLLKETAQA